MAITGVRPQGPQHFPASKPLEDAKPAHGAKGVGSQHVHHQNPILKKLLQAAKDHTAFGFDRALKRFADVDLSPGTAIGKELRAGLLKLGENINTSAYHSLEAHAKTFEDNRLMNGGSVKPGGQFHLQGGPLLTTKEIRGASFQALDLDEQLHFDDETMMNAAAALKDGLRNSDASKLREVMNVLSLQDLLKIKINLPGSKKTISVAEAIVRHPDRKVRETQHSMRNPRVSPESSFSVGKHIHKVGFLPPEIRNQRLALMEKNR